MIIIIMITITITIATIIVIKFILIITSGADVKIKDGEAADGVTVSEIADKVNHPHIMVMIIITAMMIIMVVEDHYSDDHHHGEFPSLHCCHRSHCIITIVRINVCLSEYLTDVIVLTVSSPL